MRSVKVRKSKKLLFKVCLCCIMSLRCSNAVTAMLVLAVHKFALIFHGLSIHLVHVVERRHARWAYALTKKRDTFVLYATRKLPPGSIAQERTKSEVCNGFSQAPIRHMPIQNERQ